jgi:hypothetical protein
MTVEHALMDTEVDRVTALRRGSARSRAAIVLPSP